MPEVNANNRVRITGIIISELMPSHRPGGRVFYASCISASRKSGNKDILPILIPYDLLEENRDYNGSFVRIEGQYRSLKSTGNGKSRLILYIYVTDMSFPDDNSYSERVNQIRLEGYIYRPPVLRKTPMGYDIADIFITVRRSERISDYIPCIAWNRTARMASKLSVPSRVSINGRIQSREYTKRLSDDERVKKTAYEVSVERMRIQGNGC